MDPSLHVFISKVYSLNHKCGPVARVDIMSVKVNNKIMYSLYIIIITHYYVRPQHNLLVANSLIQQDYNNMLPIFLQIYKEFVFYQSQPSDMLHLGP